jgi:hypothetical protein
MQNWPDARDELERRRDADEALRAAVTDIFDIINQSDRDAMGIAVT